MELKLMSESIGNLAAALAAAQGEFEPCKRTAVNPFFKSKYSPLDEVVAATQPALTKHGIAVSQQVVTNGSMQLLTYLLHKSGEFIGGTYPINPTKNDPQGIGSALTYARRYALMAALGVPAEDDDGQQASVPVKDAPAKTPTKQQAAPEKAATAPVEELPFPDAPVEGITDAPPASTDKYPDCDCECEVGTLKAVAKPRQVGNSTKYSVKIDEKWFCTWSDTVAGTFDALRGKGVTVYYKVKTKGNFTDNVIEHIEEA